MFSHSRPQRNLKVTTKMDMETIRGALAFNGPGFIVSDDALISEEEITALNGLFRRMKTNDRNLLFNNCTVQEMTDQLESDRNSETGIGPSSNFSEYCGRRYVDLRKHEPPFRSAEERGAYSRGLAAVTELMGVAKVAFGCNYEIGERSIIRSLACVRTKNAIVMNILIMWRMTARISQSLYFSTVLAMLWFTKAATECSRVVRIAPMDITKS